jgi:hypothetical protein
MPVDPIDPPGVPVPRGDEQEKGLPAGAPGEIAPPLRYCGAPFGPLRSGDTGATRNVLPRVRAVVDLPTSSGVLNLSGERV